MPTVWLVKHIVCFDVYGSLCEHYRRHGTVWEFSWYVLLYELHLFRPMGLLPDT